MATNNVTHQLTVAIGAALSGGFSSVTSGATSKITKIGTAIKDMEKQGALSVRTLDNLKLRYNSFLGSLNQQQAVIQKRAFYRSQIMDVVALGASLAAPINSAMKFESAMADVKKVVDFSASDGLEKMAKDLKNLSRTIPLSVEGLAQITAAGGQLGVGEKDLVSFTTNVAKMSTAFDMLPDEAGKSMATLSNVFNIPITALTQLGDAINHISNNSAASAKAVVPALARMGGAARQFGLSAEKASALVGTLIAMGKAPEEAGTAASAILQRLQLASKLGPRAEKAFRQIGISANVFPKMIEQDAQGALLTFFDALSKVEGQKRASVLVDIFGKNYSSTVATLVGSLDKYKQQLQLISDPKSYSGSMEKEFKARSATTENAIQLLKNSMNELSITLGNALLPTVADCVKGISKAVHGIVGWVSANPELTRTITHLVGGLIGMKLATFALGYASTFLLGGLNRLVIVAKGLRLAIGLLGAGMRTLLFGGLGKTVLVAGALIPVFSAINKNGVGGFADGLESLKGRLRAVAVEMEGGFLSAIEAIEGTTGLKLRPALNGIVATFKNIFSTMRMQLSPAFGAFSQRLHMVATGVISALTPSLKNFGIVFSEIIGEVRSGAIPLFEALSEVCGGSASLNVTRLTGGVVLLGTAFLMIAGRILPAVFGLFGGFGKALWSLATTIIPAVFSGISLLGRIFWFFATSVLPTIFNGFWYLSTTIMPKVWSGFSFLSVKLWEFGSGAVTSVIGAVRQLSASLWTLASNAVTPLIAKFPILGKVMRGALATGGILAFAWAAYEVYNNWEMVKNFFSTIWDGVKEYWNSFTESVDALWKSCVAVGEAIYTVFDFTKNLGMILYNVIYNVNALIGRFIFGKDVVIPAWESVKTLFENMWGGAFTHWDGFIEKIQSLNVADKIMASWQKLKTFFTGIWDDIAPKWDAFTAPLSKIWDSAKSSVSSIDSLFKSDDTKPAITSKLPPLNGAKAAPVTKNQNNSFNITVNAPKARDAEEVAKLVANKMKSYSSSFLFDPVGAVP